MSCDQPKISIVTVVLNASAELQRTIFSVSGQYYPQVEFIIIDGGSTDGTLDVIREQQEKITTWISEPDKGIYDAMNKGLERATGDWVNFMNAGDVFANAEVMYGDSIAGYPGYCVFRAALPADQLWKGMVCNHQSLFLRRAVIADTGYDLSFRIGADHELLYRLYLRGCRFVKVPVTVAIWKTGGVSDRRQVKSAMERYRLVKLHSVLHARQKAYYLLLVLLSVVVQGVYAVFPQGVVSALVKWTNRSRILQGDSRLKFDTL